MVEHAFGTLFTPTDIPNSCAIFTCLMNFVLDVDECSTNSHSCDVNAVCSDTHGSYSCACKAGYSGDGRTCSGTLFCFVAFFCFCFFSLVFFILLLCLFCFVLLSPKARAFSSFQLNNHHN